MQNGDIPIADVETRDWTGASVKDQIIGFIVSNFLFGDSSQKPEDDESLIENGIVDSTGILEMIEFIETRFGIEIAEEETVPANLDCISSLDRFIEAKMGR